MLRSLTCPRLVLPCVLLAIVATACGLDELPTATEDAVDPAGVWTFNITVTTATGACAGEEGQNSDFPITITKTGTVAPFEVTARGFLGNQSNVLQGTFDANNQLQISGGYAEDGGTTTLVHTLNAVSTDRMEGREDWTWQGSDGTCPGGVSDVVATRIN